MHRRIIIFIFLSIICCHSAVATDATDRDWWTLLKRLELDLKDSTVVYPPFIKFCVDTYNWGDELLNGQDSTYVSGVGKDWNLHLVSKNWKDIYNFNIDRTIPITTASNFYQNLGLYLQYCSISVGYSYDLSNIIQNEPSEHKKFNINLNCARFSLEGNLWRNRGGSYVRRFGNFSTGRPMKVHFPSFDQETLSLVGYYIFNHRQFSMGAAYNFNRIQRRSVGSPVLGFNLARIDVSMDFSKLPPLLKPVLPFEPAPYRIHYNSYTLMGGYSYNLRMSNPLLFNISAFPGVGYTHSYRDSDFYKSDIVGLTFNGKSSLTYSAGDFFLCLAGSLESNFYNSNALKFISSIASTELTLGIRF